MAGCSWYPPGHGNVFASLKASGVLEQLLDEGRDVIFVANIDNTAAVVDVRIASVICADDVDYVMEMTDKTAQDIKARRTLFLRTIHAGVAGRHVDRVRWGS